MSNGISLLPDPSLDRPTQNRVSGVLESAQHRVKKIITESALDFVGLLNAGIDMYDLGSQISGDGWFSYPYTIPPYYRQSQKRGEAIPIYLDEHNLRILRDRSRKLCAENPFAQAAIENRVNYIVGEDGFVIKAIASTGVEMSPTVQMLIDKAQKILDRWSEYNDLPEIEEHLMRQGDVDGDAYVRMFPQDDGLVVIRPVEAEHVKSPVGAAYGAEYSFGHQCDKHDILNIKGYWVVNDPISSNMPEFVPHATMRHVKRNTAMTAKRGMPLFYSCELLLRMAMELLRGVVTAANIRARYAIIKKYSNSIVKDAVEQMVSELNSATITDPTTGNSQNMAHKPFGSIVHSTDNASYEFPSANISAGDYDIALQMVLRAVAARTQQPEWMFTANTGDSNYSAALVAESPSTKGFGKIQKRLCKFVGMNRAKGKESLAWMQIVHAVRMGVLHPDTIKVVSLSCEGPTLAVRDKAAEAMQSRTYVDMKVKSRMMVQQELGIDPDKAKKQIEEEHKDDIKSQQLDLKVQMEQQKQQMQMQQAMGIQPGGQQDPNAPPGSQQGAPGGQQATQPGGFSSNGKDGGPPGGFGQQTEGVKLDDFRKMLSEAFGEAFASAGLQVGGYSNRRIVETCEPDKFSSTQFNLEDAGYSRVQGSPIPKLKAIQAKIPDKCLAKSGLEGELHLTILFGLHTHDPMAVAELVRGLGPVTVTLGKTSCFYCKEGAAEDKQFDVVKVDVTSTKLKQLNALLCGNLDHTSTHPKYQPHITLAYVKPGEGVDYAGLDDVSGQEITFHEVIFSDCDRNHTKISLVKDRLGLGSDGHDYSPGPTQAIPTILWESSEYASLMEATRRHGKFTGIIHIHDSLGRQYDQHWVNGEQVSQKQYRDVPAQTRRELMTGGQEVHTVKHSGELPPRNPEHDRLPEPDETHAPLGPAFERSSEADFLGKQYVEREVDMQRYERDLRKGSRNVSRLARQMGQYWDDELIAAETEAAAAKAASMMGTEADYKSVWDYLANGNPPSEESKANNADLWDYISTDRRVDRKRDDSYFGLRNAVRRTVSRGKLGQKHLANLLNDKVDQVHKDDAKKFFREQSHKAIGSTFIAASKVANALKPSEGFMLTLCYEAAKERGLPEEEAGNVASWMAYADIVYRSTLGPLMTGFFQGLLKDKGEEIAHAIGNSLGQPMAQLLYLAYSGVRNPLATLRAAKNVTLARYGLRVPQMDFDYRGNLVNVHRPVRIGWQHGVPVPINTGFGTGGRGGLGYGGSKNPVFKGKGKNAVRRETLIPRLAQLMDSGKTLDQMADILARDPRFVRPKKQTISNWLKEIRENGLDSAVSEGRDVHDPITSKQEYDVIKEKLFNRDGSFHRAGLSYNSYLKDHLFTLANALARADVEDQSTISVSLIDGSRVSSKMEPFNQLVRTDIGRSEHGSVFDQIETANGRLRDMANATQAIYGSLHVAFLPQDADKIFHDPEFWHIAKKSLDSQYNTKEDHVELNLPHLSQPMRVPKSDLDRLLKFKHAFHAKAKIDHMLDQFGDNMVQDGGLHQDYRNLNTMELWPRFEQAVMSGSPSDPQVHVHLPGVPDPVPFNRSDVARALSLGQAMT